MRKKPDDTPSAPATEPLKLSPMMAQYSAIKAANPDSLLFYRMGDFYELFFDDAEIAAPVLGIVLTKRGKHEGTDIPMCGVPVERAEDYLHKLIAKGHKVAVCEQTEDPAQARKRGAKSVVQRDVVRLVTPGTITEDLLLDPGRPNALLAITRMGEASGHPVFGLAAADISTGSFSVLGVAEDGLLSEVARIDPAEIVVPEALADHPGIKRLSDEMHRPLTMVGRGIGEGQGAERRLKDFFGLATLEGLGGLTQAEIAAASLGISYIERTQCAARPALSLPARDSAAAHLEIDAATRANLELTRRLNGDHEGSLVATIDETLTPAGRRLLNERISAPLTNAEAIGRRLDTLAFFLDEPDLRQKIREALKSTPDFARALSRLALLRGGPRDLAALREGLRHARKIASLFEPHILPNDLAEAKGLAAAVNEEFIAELTEALAETLPLNRRDGGFVRAGYDPALDELRALRDESRRVIAALQARYCDLAGTRQLKLKHNHFLGFFLEVPQAQGERFLKPPFDTIFIHRQTMAGAMRFSTSELAELDAKISSAGEEALAKEQVIFDDLAARATAEQAVIMDCAKALAIIDVAAALAEVAASRDWTRPQVDTSMAFEIVAGRHPVVEAALRKAGEGFIPNNCKLSGATGKGGRIAVVTGPNMAGKSTYLRQNALIAILAQAGSFVPAASAHIGLVDRLFSRVGAADDLARGRSTFMVEMVETAAILNQARERSLIILDEIGRGTATFDGLSIAWAVMEHLHECSRSRALFATHYHELTQLAKQFDRIDNLTVRVTDWNGDIVFLHEIVAGAADRSYGIQVAKLAGLPASVIARARTLLAEFEAADRLVHAERLVADLPLFAPPPAKPARDHDDFGSTRSKVMKVIDSKNSARDAGGEPVATSPHPAQDHDDVGLTRSKVMKVIDSKNSARDAGGEPVSSSPHPALADRLGAKLDAIDPDGLTPREALAALYELKALRDGKG